MSRLWIAAIVMLSMGLMITGCRVEGEIDDATSITVPR